MFRTTLFLAGMVSISVVASAQQKTDLPVRLVAANYVSPVGSGGVRVDWLEDQAGQSSSSQQGSLGSTATITVVPTKDTPTDKKAAKVRVEAQTLHDEPVRAFSKVGIAVSISSLGPGLEIATPLSRSFNVRGGATFFKYNDSLTQDGIDYTGDLNVKSGRVSLDWFPFHGGFHVSPGMLILSADVNAAASVKGGDHFTLDDVDYTSSVQDPVRGTGQLTFPRMVSPALTVGWGNIVPRSGKHWSVPFEIGAAYIGQTNITIKLAGTACQTQGCFNAATDPTVQSNLKLEQNTLNDDLKKIQVYPIVSLGLSYKF